MQKYLMTYFQCQQHHEPMNLVCLEQNCPKKGIICPHCEYQNHKHPVKALRMLMGEIERDMNIYQSCLSLLSQIDLAYVQIIQEINKITSTTQKMSVKEMAINYFQYNVGSLFRRSKIVQQYESLEIKTVEKMNQFIIRYNFVDKALNTNNYSNTQYEIRGRLQELNSSLKQIKQAIKNNLSLNVMMKIFEIDDNRRIKYFFNSEKCHRDIIISDKTKIQLKEGYSYRIGLIDPPIRKQNGKIKKKTITFKISKVTALVGVGVVFKKKVQTANYLFSAYSQHGCYFITNSGYTYNQSNPTYNSQMKNWTFTTNDIIKVTIDPKEKKIVFQKQGKDIFELPFEQKPDLEINFGVLLCQQHQSVQIMYV